MVKFILLALLFAGVLLTAVSGEPVQAQTTSTLWRWGDWVATSGEPRPHDAATASRLANEEAARENGRDRDRVLARGLLTYDLWQWGISSLSNLGPISPIHGRREVVANAEVIKYWAPDDLKLVVAASIAHQASDFKDRPFGTDAVEAVWSELIDANISIGIAQLRQAEVLQWVPFLHEVDLLSPEVAIRVMTAKLTQANAYIQQNYPDISITDRYMLLALAQNAAAFRTIQTTIDYFFEVARADWNVMLASELGTARNWRMQLRLVLLHLDWLVEQGWPVPAGLDRDFWTMVAFGKPE